MRRIATLLFISLLFSKQLKSQIIPAEESKLHYRIVGFSFPAIEQIDNYKVEIATGYFNNEDSFQKHVITTVSGSTNKLAEEVPAFGYYYTWRAIYTRDSTILSKSDLHHFSTSFLPKTDTGNVRLRILSPATRYKDAFVFVDGNRTLYDMAGMPVWFNPMTEDGAVRKGASYRDIRRTSSNTITFLYDEDAYEINYDGKVLWKAPNDGKVSGDTSEHYHHELTRLANGHYMVLSTQRLPWPGEAVPGSAGNEKVQFGTIIEYDEKGKVVWSWKSSSYFFKAGIIYKSDGRTKVQDVHENSFFFDEANKFIYVSFKNISRVLKVKYPEGDVVRNYDGTIKPGIPQGDKVLFCDQHAINRSTKGYLYLYNNNGCNDSSLPQVVMLQEPAKDAEPLKKVWEYECNSEDVNIHPSVLKAKERQKAFEIAHRRGPVNKGSVLRATTGGNVSELPDGSMFVCMNTQYSKIFIVSPEKKILWAAIAEKWYNEEKSWFIASNQYRASIISRKELEDLIWNSEAK